MQIPPMPFKILALAPFNANTETVWSESPLPVDKSELDDAVNNLGISLYIPVPSDLCPDGGIELNISRFKDFKPDQLAKKNTYLKNLIDAKTYVEKSKAEGKTLQEIGETIKNWSGLPQLKPETAPPKAVKTTNSAVDNILDMVALPDEVPQATSSGHSFSEQLSDLLARCLGHIFSDKTFRALESIWQGVKLLLQDGCINGDVKLEIVPVSFDTLKDTLDELTQNVIRDLPSLILIDLPFDNTSQSTDLMEKIATFSETLMVPAVVEVTKKFFYLDHWNDFNKLPFLPNYIDESQFAKWRHIAGTSSGRWVGVTCNRFLSRYAYGPENPSRNIDFRETENLSTSPVWALGNLVAKSVSKTGWPTRFTDFQEIQIQGLPLNTENPNMPISTEIYFTNDRLDQLLRIGIMPLSGHPKKDIAFIPKEIAISGNSFRYQLMLSAVTRFIFWCQDNFSKDLEPVELEKSFLRAFTLFWERSGHHAPDTLNVSVGEKMENGRIPLRIELKPPHEILPSGEKIELELAW